MIEFQYFSKVETIRELSSPYLKLQFLHINIQTK